MTHGLRTTYVRGCRCEDCRAANRTYANTLLRRNARARWNPEDQFLVDALPARVHVGYLQAHGIGYRRIAELSGVAVTVVARLAGIVNDKPADRVRPDTLRKLLTVKPNQPAPGQRVPSLGARRRIQALVALGWPISHLANRIGWTTSNLSTMLDRDEVIASTNQTIRELFTELQLVPGPSTRARIFASRRGWLPPLAWDDIDTDYHDTL